MHATKEFSLEILNVCLALFMPVLEKNEKIELFDFDLISDQNSVWNKYFDTCSYYDREVLGKEPELKTKTTNLFISELF
jgi:hypothetical protein